MATHNLAGGMAHDGPIIPDEDLERLLAEMFGRRRSAPKPVQAPVAAPVAAPSPRVAEHEPAAVEPVEPPALIPEPRLVAREADETGPSVEPLHLPRPRRRGRKTALVTLLALALAAGWWASGMPRPEAVTALLQKASLLSEPQSPASREPPIIAAPPPAAVRAAPPSAMDAPASAPAASAPISPAPAQPSPRVVTPAPQPPADGAGVLGKPETSPFDQATAPRAVRTTAVLPPRAEADAANGAPKPLDFDDPSTWPAGAEKADPHPLPPRRP